MYNDHLLIETIHIHIPYIMTPSPPPQQRVEEMTEAAQWHLCKNLNNLFMIINDQWQYQNTKNGRTHLHTSHDVSIY